MLTNGTHLGRSLCLLGLSCLLNGCTGNLPSHWVQSGLKLGQDALLTLIDTHTNDPRMLQDGYRLVHDLSDALQNQSKASQPQAL